MPRKFESLDSQGAQPPPAKPPRKRNRCLIRKFAFFGLKNRFSLIRPYLVWRQWWRQKRCLRTCFANKALIRKNASRGWSFNFRKNNKNKTQSRPKFEKKHAKKKKTQTKPKLEKKQSTSLVASTVAVLISGVRTEAQDIVRSSEAVVRSFSANARARV